MNEPIARLNTRGNGIAIDWLIQPKEIFAIADGTELYTHPVKQITDTEIWAISTKFDLNHVYGICDFARKIERKITE